MKDTPLEGPHEATVLAGDSPDAYNSIEAPRQVVPEQTQLVFDRGTVGLLPHSLTIVRIEPSGDGASRQRE